MSEHAHPFDPPAVESARRHGMSAEEATELRRLLAILGEPVRARALSALLAAGELCVGDVAVALGVSEDAASHAVRTLRREGLVELRTEGRMRFYRITTGPRRNGLTAALDCFATLVTRAACPPAVGRSQPSLSG